MVNHILINFKHIIIFCTSSYRLYSYSYCDRNFAIRIIWHFYIIERWTNLIFSDNKIYKSIVVSFDSCTNYWYYLLLMIFVVIRHYTKVLNNSNTKFRLQYRYKLCEEGQNMILKKYSFRKCVIAPPHVACCCYMLYKWYDYTK